MNKLIKHDMLHVYFNIYRAYVYISFYCPILLALYQSYRDRRGGPQVGGGGGGGGRSANHDWFSHNRPQFN